MDDGINCTGTGLIYAHFLWFLIMLNKTLKNQRLHLPFTRIAPRIARIFSPHELGFLRPT